MALPALQLGSPEAKQATQPATFKNEVVKTAEAV